jgi:hypothetical protein
MERPDHRNTGFSCACVTWKIENSGWKINGNSKGGGVSLKRRVAQKHHEELTNLIVNCRKRFSQTSEFHSRLCLLTIYLMNDLFILEE